MDPLKNVKLAVIGYGIQGAAQASKMKDSGLDVWCRIAPNGKTWAKAQNDNHKVKVVSDAVKESDIIHILIPDMEQDETFNNVMAPYLTENKTISFSHGAAIHWKWIPSSEKH